MGDDPNSLLIMETLVRTDTAGSSELIRTNEGGWAWAPDKAGLDSWTYEWEKGPQLTSRVGGRRMERG